MAARERDSGRAEAMPRGRDGWRVEGMTSGRDGERAEAMPRDGKAASGRDAEGMVGERSEQCLGEARLWLAPHS